MKNIAQIITLLAFFGASAANASLEGEHACKGHPSPADGCGMCSESMSEELFE